MQVEPEAALKLTNRKFRRRFAYIETSLHDRGQAFDQTSIDELEDLWQEAKGVSIRQMVRCPANPLTTGRD